MLRGQQDVGAGDRADVAGVRGWHGCSCEDPTSHRLSYFPLVTRVLQQREVTPQLKSSPHLGFSARALFFGLVFGLYPGYEGQKAVTSSWH